MKGLREFEIAYVGMKLGVHKYEYDINASFFKHFEESLIKECDVKVKLEFEKKETFFIANFFIDGSVKVECDRCLGPFDKSIFGDYTCYIKFAEDPNSMNDEPEVLYISRDQTVIDLSQLIYEYVNLCLPIQKLGCEKPGEEPQCNKEVLKYLKGEEKKETNEDDPRWAALKNLKN
ncbi:MAG TPA: DUF177 domain-containing protein [Chitinophagales bacterium]|nr:DUF177 domain-containing protein [Chitinophagales bacterium]